MHGDIVAPALESPVVRHPPGTSAGSWSPPVSDAAGWRDLSHQAIHSAARDGLEPRLGKGSPTGSRRRSAPTMTSIDADSQHHQPRKSRHDPPRFAR